MECSCTSAILSEDCRCAQVGGARKRLQAAVQDRDPLALASAINWAQEVSNATGQLTQVSRKALQHG